jgi:hypothetical protein
VKYRIAIVGDVITGTVIYSVWERGSLRSIWRREVAAAEAAGLVNVRLVEVGAI